MAEQSKTCPHCGREEVEPGAYACGSKWKRTWYGRKRLVLSHECRQEKKCANACMDLIADTINHNAKARSWRFGDVAASDGRGFDDWTVTVTQKAHRAVKRKH